MITVDDVLTTVGTRMYPETLINELLFGIHMPTYYEVIEVIQQAFERGLIMYDSEAYVVPHDGKYYND